MSGATPTPTSSCDCPTCLQTLLNAPWEQNHPSLTTAAMYPHFPKPVGHGTNSLRCSQRKSLHGQMRVHNPEWNRLLCCGNAQPGHTVILLYVVRAQRRRSRASWSTFHHCKYRTAHRSVWWACFGRHYYWPNLPTVTQVVTAGGWRGTENFISAPSSPSLTPDSAQSRHIHSFISHSAVFFEVQANPEIILLCLFSRDWCASVSPQAILHSGLPRPPAPWKPCLTEAGWH